MSLTRLPGWLTRDGSDIAERPKTRGKADIRVEGRAERADLHAQPGSGRGRQAELTGEQADLVGPAPGHAIERVRDQVARARAADEGRRASQQRGRLAVAHHRLAVAGEGVGIDRSDT